MPGSTNDPSSQPRKLAGAGTSFAVGPIGHERIYGAHALACQCRPPVLSRQKKKDRERTPRRSRSFPRIFANALADKGVSVQTTAFSPGPPGAPGASPGSRTVLGPATTIGA